MLLLTIYAFLAGLATVLSPCILPVLPIVLSSSLGGDRWRPLGVVAGLIVSFAVATLAISSLISALHIPPDALRNFGIIIIALAGLALLIPELWYGLEAMLGRVGNLGARLQGEPRRGAAGGFLVGVGLGLVWTPCAGPILATVLALAATNKASAGASVVTIAYSLGAAIPMLGIAYGGQVVLQRVRGLSRRAGTIQRLFGVIMLLTALALTTGVDRDFQVWASANFPGGWNTPFTNVEDSGPVRDALGNLRPVAPAQPTTTAAVEKVSLKDAILGMQDLGPAPEFTGITNWFNTPAPLTMAGLRGKVVLVDFWTYSCINCLRTLPHLKDWYARYKSDGLEIVGVHSPEFAFEGVPANLAAAIRQWSIPYPVALDPAYATWNAYRNEYWPAEYLIDAQGHIRYTSFGEGDYSKTESAIRQLLADANHPVKMAAGKVADTTPTYQMTPETYINSERMTNFASPQTVNPGQAQVFTIPSTLPADQFGLAGRWQVNGQESTALDAGDSLDFTVTADKVFVIFAPPGPQAKVRVSIDGAPVKPGVTAGADVQGGEVTVNMDNLYNVVDLHGPVQTHRVHLVFETPGTQVYSFTFG
jgi:cytochrome c biogenesis protein CcdA/thiol-disulfide isomerase/thioredoxin